MKLRQFATTLCLSAIAFIGTSAYSEVLAPEDDDILDMIMPLMASIRPSIPMPTGNALSLPLGTGNSPSGPVMCPNREPAPNGDVGKCTNISANEITLQNSIRHSYPNAPACNVPINGAKQFYPSIQYPDHTVGGKPDSCGYNDMTLFNGLICAGDVYKYGWPVSASIGCQAVRDAQDSSGQMWRSPYRKITSGLGDPNTFSPDMDLGVLLYSVVTKDTSLLENWWKWIDEHTSCVQTKLDLVSARRDSPAPR